MTARAVTPIAVVALATISMGPAPKDEATATAVCTAQAWPSPTTTASASRPGAVRSEPGPNEVGAPYFAIDLAPTKKIPGTARARGVASVTFAPSPYGIAVGSDGSYTVDLRIALSGLRTPSTGHLVAWATTPQIDRIQRIGALDENLSVEGRVTWNQFLLIVTLEKRDDPAATTWSGPIVFRGVSRSGLMHTMAGHGPFQQEWCAKYGYE